MQSQMEKEKENLSLFEQALTIARANPVKKAKGIIEENIRILRDVSSDMVQRSTVIELLKVLAEDEKRHIKMLNAVILDLVEHRRKSGN
jgi:rubrerythrin